ncbi:MAG TPA: DNA polymerase domain-containing protein [Nitrososphaeraceae archaeon]|nr:DNA polymerase domain-containing protein [Nitrososphaeraceae archaeon]
MISGWLFDAYALNGSMIFWIKRDNSSTAIRVEDKSWNHKIYVASEKSLLKSVIENNEILSMVKEYHFISKYELIKDMKKSQVLELELKDPTYALKLAKKIEKMGRFGQIRLYNVDILPEQSYFYEHDVFPLMKCKVHVSNSTLNWIDNEDDVWSTEYELPLFNNIHLKVYPKTKEGRISRFTDVIALVSIQKGDTSKDTIYIQGSEIDILYQLVKEVEKINPDFILTEYGDSFTFPYLTHRSEINQVNLILDREGTPLYKPKKDGTSYFSYGRMYFKPSATKLLGRIHIDTDNSFVLNESGLQGLYELARICRLPLHSASRASIGKCMSSLQFYNAVRNNILIPWKPTLAEHPKSLGDLLIADRGGLIFEPIMGAHEKVAELDFVSLYPTIMFKKNISAETVICNCCSYSKLRIPELLNYHICEKRRGIVPLSLEILLKKRAHYKDKRNSTTDPELKKIYDARQTALKWVLVTSFGYLGFNNAKFGRIDAHIAVCAFDRQILLQTVRIAESQGFKILHAIVDSIWIQKKNVINNDYKGLKTEIENKTGFPISFEGIYKWIVFVTSKSNTILPVSNRYFGVFEDGTVKMRGIEARRHDTAEFFSNVQQGILNIMSEANSIKEVRDLMPKVRKFFQMHLELLRYKKVPINDLVLTKRISKDVDEYKNMNTVELDALLQLKHAGKSLKSGQILKYVLTDYYRKNSRKRSVPVELINSKTVYDAKRYSELLVETCNSVTEPFGLKLTNEL